MDERTLYTAILGVTAPWKVDRVELHLSEGQIDIWVALPEKQLWVCPECRGAGSDP